MSSEKTTTTKCSQKYVSKILFLETPIKCLVESTFSENDSPGYETLLKKTTSRIVPKLFPNINKHFFPGKIPINIYLFTVNNRNTRKRYGLYSKLIIKTPKKRH